jgi:hypothetical protein
VAGSGGSAHLAAHSAGAQYRGAGADRRVGEQTADGGAEEAAGAVDGVARRQDRPPPRVLHLDSVDVHRNVQRAVDRAEREQADRQAGQVERQGGQHQQRAVGERRRDHDPAAPVAVDQPARDLHAEDGAGGEGQQADAELAVAQPEPLLDRRYAGGPGAEDRAVREEQERHRHPTAGEGDRGASGGGPRHALHGAGIGVSSCDIQASCCLEAGHRCHEQAVRQCPEKPT